MPLQLNGDSLFYDFFLELLGDGSSISFTLTSFISSLSNSKIYLLRLECMRGEDSSSLGFALSKISLICEDSCLAIPNTNDDVFESYPCIKNLFSLNDTELSLS